MRGRPAEFDPEEALQAAMAVFWSQGYTGTSVSDLLEATHLSRSSLYQTFTSKEALFRTCLQHYCESFAQKMHGDLEQAPSGRAYIDQVFLNIARQADDPELRRGCLAMNSAMEFGHQDSALAGEVRAGLQRFVDVFTCAVKRAQAEGDIPAHRSATDLGQYLVSSMSGVRMLIKSGIKPQEAERIVRLILQALD